MLVASDIVGVFRDALVIFCYVTTVIILIFSNASLMSILFSRFILDLARVGTQMSDTDRGTGATGGIHTTQWKGEISDVASQWSLDDEYNGRGFDKDIDTFEAKECHEA